MSPTEATERAYVQFPVVAKDVHVGRPYAFVTVWIRLLRVAGFQVPSRAGFG